MVRVSLNKGIKAKNSLGTRVSEVVFDYNIPNLSTSIETSQFNDLI